MSSTDKDPFLQCDGIDASEQSEKAFLNGNLMSPIARTKMYKVHFGGCMPTSSLLGDNGCCFTETRTETRHGTQDRVH
jgi:hypothetical protein